MEDNIFDIAFEVHDQKYSGWVNPSDKMNEKGKPISFHVVLNDVSFGHLSYNDVKWIASEERPAELVHIVGEQIEKYYSGINQET